MAHGTVKWFSPQKGYGFIVQEDGTDIFVHISAIRGSRTLQEGQRCTFDVQPSPRGQQAINVVPGEQDPNFTPPERPRRERGLGGGRGDFGVGGRRRDDLFPRDRGGQGRF